MARRNSIGRNNRRSQVTSVESLECRRLMAFAFERGGNFGPVAPQSAALGDVNGDGMLDGVGVQFNGWGIFLQLGDGRGSFGAPVIFDSVGEKTGVRLGDVNRDGNLDLVYNCRSDGKLRTRFGNGDGTFGAESIRAQLASQDLVHLELADINGDGFLDAVGGSISAGVRVALDNGTGTFDAGLIQFDGCGGLTDMIVVDATGDGQLDVVMSTLVGPDIAVLSDLRSTPSLSGTNFGSGFAGSTRLAVAPSGSGLVFALVETGASGRMVYGRNPAAPSNVHIAPQPIGNSLGIAIADFDNNGVPDLAWTARPDVSQAVLNLYVVSGNASGEPFSGTATQFPAGSAAQRIDATDVNGDGNSDIVILTGGQFNGFDAVSVLLNRQQSLVVSTTADENDASGDWFSGTGTSLREAVAYANTLSGPRTITFAPFLANAGATVNVNNGPITAGVELAQKDLTITNTRGRITIRGGGTNQGLLVPAFSMLTLRDVTLSNFNAGANNGGAVSVDQAGAFLAERVTFTNNTTGSGLGSAVWGRNISAVTLRNSTFTGNTGNAAIALDASGVSGTWPMVLEHNTIANNASGVRVTAGTVALRNNIIAGNGAADFNGLATGSKNIIQTGAPAGLNGTINADPRLNPLANNGGFANTMSMQADSPALEAAAALAGITTDQRGVARPQFAAPDIGAFEARPSDLNLPSVTTPDGALWYLFTSVGADRRIYRQAIGQPAVEVDGGATFIALQSDGNVVVRNAAGNVYTRDGSLNGVGTGWNQRPTVAAGDNANWFLGTDGIGQDRAIYRWANDATAQNSGGWGTRLTTVGGVIVTQTSTGAIFFRQGSAAGLGTDWVGTAKTVAGDTATWFILGPVGQGGSIFRWANNAAPQSAGGSGITLSTTPAGDIRTVNAEQSAYQRMGSAAGLGSEWRLISESLVVTTTADENDFTSSSNFGTGTSLREALRFAEQSAGADTITFTSALAGQTITLNDGWSGASDSSAMVIASGSNVTINGSGQTLSIAAGPQRRHVRVEGGGSLIVSNLTFANGRAPDNGGAIWNFGSLTVANATFTNNSADGQGGAIQSWGGSTLLKVDNATFAANTANAGSAIATGALSNTLDHVTIVDNVASAAGGSMLVYQTSVTMRNSIVARNTNDGTAFNGDASGTYSAASTNNLVGSGAWTGQNPATNQLAVDGVALKMGTLANNGGLTRTVAALPGSPAINAGVALAGITSDQRGIARPQGSKPDIGAYERQATTAVLSDISYENETRQAITFSFDGDAAVTFDRSAYGIQNLTTGQPVASITGSLDFNIAGTQAVLTLTNLLPDGEYRLSSGSSQRDFTVFAGDANADRRVDISDFAILASRFNLPGTFSQGDFNYDGVTAIGDFSILASKFNQELPALGPSTHRQSSASTAPTVMPAALPHQPSVHSMQSPSVARSASAPFRRLPIRFGSTMPEEFPHRLR